MPDSTSPDADLRVTVDALRAVPGTNVLGRSLPLSSETLTDLLSVSWSTVAAVTAMGHGLGLSLGQAHAEESVRLSTETRTVRSFLASIRATTSRS
jgi:hypothetical protein